MARSLCYPREELQSPTGNQLLNGYPAFGHFRNVPNDLTLDIYYFKATGSTIGKIYFKIYFY